MGASRAPGVRAGGARAARVRGGGGRRRRGPPGWHVRAGLLHGDIVSLNLVWQTLPYEARGPELRRGRSHALYGGVMAHGRVGALVSLGAWGAVAAIVVAVLSAYRNG